MDYACYYAKEPFEILRLAYGSILSSWALLNSGDEKSGYGWWFPGKENDGCACGGFEPLYGHRTWLEQPCLGGAWYYSCEIDLGFCGGVRGASVILAEDPLFGMTAYGAGLCRKEEGWILHGRDGVGRRFHYIGKQGKIHVELEGVRLEPEESIYMEDGCRRLELRFTGQGTEGNIKILTEELGDYLVEGSGALIREGEAFACRPEGGRLSLVRKQ